MSGERRPLRLVIGALIVAALCYATAGCALLNRTQCEPWKFCYKPAPCTGEWLELAEGGCIQSVAPDVECPTAASEATQ